MFFSKKVLIKNFYKIRLSAAFVNFLTARGALLAVNVKQLFCIYLFPVEIHKNMQPSNSRMKLQNFLVHLKKSLEI